MTGSFPCRCHRRLGGGKVTHFRHDPESRDCPAHRRPLTGTGTDAVAAAEMTAKAAKPGRDFRWTWPATACHTSPITSGIRVRVVAAVWRCGEMRFSGTLPGTIVMLVAAMAAGIAAIVAARRWLRPESSGRSRRGGHPAGNLGGAGAFGLGDRIGLAGGVGNLRLGGRGENGGHAGHAGHGGHGDWETMLAAYKNLRDEGVLSEEEFRKIRTLVEPRPRTGTPELRARHWPPSDPAGPAQARE
jgi:hypothetical protein